MLITCSDKCLYQEDGICVLTHITSSSGEATENCAYFRSSARNYDNTLVNKK